MKLDKIDKVRLGLRMAADGNVMRDDLIEWMKDVTTTVNRLVEAIDRCESPIVLERMDKMGLRSAVQLYKSKFDPNSACPDEVCHHKIGEHD